MFSCEKKVGVAAYKRNVFVPILMGVEGGLALSVFLIGCVAVSSLSARNGTSPAPYIYIGLGAATAFSGVQKNMERVLS